MRPLAYSLRPTKLSDIIGQNHLIGAKGPIARMIKNKKLSSLILYGDPGIGKTTLALVIANELEANYSLFSSATDNKALLKEIIENAPENKQSILIVDEIHRMKKDIQDYLLPFVENGTITIIGLTTINPYHSVNPAIRSRTVIYKLNPLNNENMLKILDNSLKKLEIYENINKDVKEYLISISNGDVRNLLNSLELVNNLLEKDNINLDEVKRIIMKASASLDKNGDNYYDTLSGLQKSIRGSDVDASLHYLARLLFSEDLIPLIRRLYAIFYEDIGLANPSLGPRLRAACEASLELGMPEARLPLGEIVIEMALSPKSNSALIAIDKALKDIEDGKGGNLPLHLKNTYSFDPNQKKYLYPHDYPGNWVLQQYLPDSIKNSKYYEPQETSKYEKALKERFDAINKAKSK